MTKKKKQIRLLIVLLCLAILGTVYGYVRQKNWDEETEETSALIAVLELSPAEISAAKIINSQGTLLLSCNGGEWKSEDDTEAVLDQDTLTSLMNRLNPLTAVRELGQVPEDLSVYGLAEPELTIQIAKLDDSELSVYIGTEASDGNVYLMTSEGQTVYTADSAIKSAFECGLEDLRAAEEEEE